MDLVWFAVFCVVWMFCLVALVACFEPFPSEPDEDE